MRLCCDYQKLKVKRVLTRHPLPRVQNIIDGIGSNQYFTLMDQSKASHQLYLHQKIQKLTAFKTPWGFYEWLRVLFGLTNAPVAFQRSKHRLGDFCNKFVAPYLENLLIFSKSCNKYLEHTQQVLQRLKKHNTKIKSSKCKCFKREVSLRSISVY